MAASANTASEKNSGCLNVNIRGCLVGWLVGWLVGLGELGCWLTGWLVDRGRLIGRSVTATVLASLTNGYVGSLVKRTCRCHWRLK